MSYRFKKHYTREEASALLPQVRGWLKSLTDLRTALEKSEERLLAMRRPGDDLGGELVNSSIRLIADIKDALVQFQQREIQIKDLSRGLLDFPAIIGGREVFLCWEQDEEDIEFWHDLDSGYAGRERL